MSYYYNKKIISVNQLSIAYIFLNRVTVYIMQVSMLRPTPPGLQDVEDGWGFDMQNCQLPHPGAGFHCQIPCIHPSIYASGL